MWLTKSFSGLFVIYIVCLNNYFSFQHFAFLEGYFLAAPRRILPISQILFLPCGRRGSTTLNALVRKRDHIKITPYRVLKPEAAPFPFHH